MAKDLQLLLESLNGFKKSRIRIPTSYCLNVPDTQICLCVHSIGCKLGCVKAKEMAILSFLSKNDSLTPRAVVIYWLKLVHLPNLLVNKPLGLPSQNYPEYVYQSSCLNWDIRSDFLFQNKQNGRIFLHM